MFEHSQRCCKCFLMALVATAVFPVFVGKTMMSFSPCSILRLISSWYDLSLKVSFVFPASEVNCDEPGRSRLKI